MLGAVVGRILLLEGSPKANIPMNTRTRAQCSKPCHWGPAPKSGLRLWAQAGECLVAGLMPMEPGRAQPEVEKSVREICGG